MEACTDAGDTAYLGEGKGPWEFGWRVCKLSFDVDWNGFSFQTFKRTSGGQ